MGSFNFRACGCCGQTSSGGGKYWCLQDAEGERHWCPGKRTWRLGCSWGRRQPGKGRGAGDRDRRAAEPARAELRSAAKPQCLRRQPWGLGLLSLQCWQKKSQRDRQLPAPGMNLSPSQAPCLPPFPWRVLGGVLACFATHVAPSQGWRQWLGRQ